MAIVKWFLRQTRAKKVLIISFFFGLVVFAFCLPSPLFDDPVCMVLEAENGELLGARIASDEQWRFPPREKVPLKFREAIVAFEDKRFFSHPGFDPIAFGRALYHNIRKGEIVSGGSTLTMQVIRISRKGKSRTVVEKIIEIIQSLRLELSYSKEEILGLYASHAPFGGNTVGLDAAAWRYFGKSPELMSWGETSLLAVLPNSPSLIHPGRNREALLLKRNKLLKKLFQNSFISESTYKLAVDEPIPDQPQALPRITPHLLDRVGREIFKNKKDNDWMLTSTIDATMQEKITSICQRYSNLLRNNDVNNLAALVIEIETGEVKAYVGNAPGTGPLNGEEVDIITSKRSTGSILKPLLYALMLQEGSILPKSLVSDVPTNLNGFKPENYLETYDGVVKADVALARSLNVPFVRMLQNYGLEKFHYNLKKLGLTTLNQPPSHYGLTLILGGAEGTLWEITNIYACMARTLKNHYIHNGFYDELDWRPPTYIRNNLSNSTKPDLQKTTPFLSSDAIWFAFEAMNEVVRPSSEGDWQRFQSSRRIAWKTGTSYGNRDAWAIGITPKYAVGIWIGNADGEGRPGLVGVQAAAPLLFDIFELLPQGLWFDAPFDNFSKLAICKTSGYLALDICEKDTVNVPQNAINARSCPYHQIIPLDPLEKWRVNSSCELPVNMKLVSWFTLPPLEEHYYRIKNPVYKTLPAFKPGCNTYTVSELPMQLIYPKDPLKIKVPIDLDGRPSRAVFKVAHRVENAILYWHLDNEYVGQTNAFHTFEFKPTYGVHKLTVVDERGNLLEQKFEVLPNNP